MSDEAEVFARRVYSGNPHNAKVIFEGYEGMPHCFAMVPWNWAGRTALRNWGKFCHYVVQGAIDEVIDPQDKGDSVWARLFDPDAREYATWTSSKTKVTRKVHLESLGLTQIGCGYPRKVALDEAEVDRRVDESRRRRIDWEDALVTKWKQTEGAKR
jgi:hypothetical protein